MSWLYCTARGIVEPLRNHELLTRRAVTAAILTAALATAAAWLIEV